MEEQEGADHDKEIEELNADAELSLEELRAKYGVGTAPQEPGMLCISIYLNIKYCTTCKLLIDAFILTLQKKKWRPLHLRMKRPKWKTKK